MEHNLACLLGSLLCCYWPWKVTVSRSNELTPTFQEKSNIFNLRSVLWECILPCVISANSSQHHHSLRFVMELLQWNKVYNLGEDELQRAPMVAFIVFPVHWSVYQHVLCMLVLVAAKEIAQRAYFKWCWTISFAFCTLHIQEICMTLYIWEYS